MRCPNASFFDKVQDLRGVFAVHQDQNPTKYLLAKPGFPGRRPANVLLEPQFSVHNDTPVAVELSTEHPRLWPRAKPPPRICIAFPTVSRFPPYRPPQSQRSFQGNVRLKVTLVSR